MLNVIKKHLGIALLLCASFYWTWCCGHRGFSALDQSIVFDGAYRITQGQMQYRDFYAPFGPVSFLMQAGIFRVFNVSIEVYVLGAAILNLIATLVTLFILNSVYQRFNAAALIGAGATALWFYPPMGTPYADHNALLFNMIALLLLIRGLRRFSRWLFFFAGFVLALALLTKQNYAVFFLPVCLVLLLVGCYNALRTYFMSVFLVMLGLAIPIISYLLWLYHKGALSCFIEYFIAIPGRLGIDRISNISLAHIFMSRINAAVMPIPLCGIAATLYLAIRNRGTDRAEAQRQGNIRFALLLVLVIYTLFMQQTTRNNVCLSWGLLGIIYGVSLHSMQTLVHDLHWKQIARLFLVMLYGISFATGVFVSFTRRGHDLQDALCYSRITEPPRMRRLLWADPTWVGTKERKSYYVFSEELMRLCKELNVMQRPFFIFPDYTFLY